MSGPTYTLRLSLAALGEVSRSLASEPTQGTNRAARVEAHKAVSDASSAPPMSGPMDPERLADLREGLDDNRATERPVPHDLVCELLAERDNLAREVDRLGVECDVLAGTIRTLLSTARAAEAVVERLRGERDAAHRDLSIAYGRSECGQRFPPQATLTAAAREVAERNGWPDPYPEVERP